MQRHLLQGGEGGEDSSREEAQLVVVEEESPQGRQVSERRWKPSRQSAQDRNRIPEGTLNRQSPTPEGLWVDVGQLWVVVEL